MNPAAISRRRLILGIGAALVAPQVFGQADRRLRRVGIAFNSNPESARPYADAFVRGMLENGLRVDRDYALDARYAQGRNDRYQAIMGELVGARVDVIVVGPNTGVQAAKAVTSAVPIVMAGATDPESTGLVASLARPGGNVTGLAFNSIGLVGKRFQLVSEILPGAERVAYLNDPGALGGASFMPGIEDAARKLSLRLAPTAASNAEEPDQALASLALRRPDALVVSGAIIFWTHRKRIVDYCAQHRVPSIFSYSEPVVDGGLLSYAPNLKDAFRRSATYVARILGGATPESLPVEQPTRFELVVNMKTAIALDIAIPSSVLARADDVIR